jgi:hypothetical protein
MAAAGRFKTQKIELAAAAIPPKAARIGAYAALSGTGVS